MQISHAKSIEKYIIIFVCHIHPFTHSLMHPVFIVVVVHPQRSYSSIFIHSRIISGELTINDWFLALKCLIRHFFLFCFGAAVVFIQCKWFEFPIMENAKICAYCDYEFVGHKCAYRDILFNWIISIWPKNAWHMDWFSPNSIVNTASLIRSCNCILIAFDICKFLITIDVIFEIWMIAIRVDRIILAWHEIDSPIRVVVFVRLQIYH